MIDLADKLLRLREYNELSQFDVGIALGVSHKIVSKWERGEYIPSAQELINIMQLYKVNFFDLFKEDVIENIRYDQMRKKVGNEFLSELMMNIFTTTVISNITLLILNLIFFSNNLACVFIQGVLVVILFIFCVIFLKKVGDDVGYIIYTFNG